MKFSHIVVLGEISCLAFAEPVERYNMMSAVCASPTVTVTVTKNAATGAYTPPAGEVSGTVNGLPSIVTQKPADTWTSTVSTLVPSYASWAVAPSKTHKVDVGAFGNLVFNPNQIYAAVGDVVEFNFLAKNHSVTQSNFRTPCTFNGGFDTGLNQFNPKNQSGLFIKSFAVKNTKPTWFYCKQGGPPNHCGKGMVFGINPAGKMGQFIENAKHQNGFGNSASNSTTVTTTSGSTVTDCATATTTVTVGLEKGKVLKFDPPFLRKTNKGDVIHFDFRAVNHTLTESSFDDPCKKLAGTVVDTNFQNVNPDDIPNLRSFDLTVDTDADKPRWFYCKQKSGTPQGHCGQGMVFAINPKSEWQFNQFLQKAKSTLPKVKGRGLGLGEMW